MVDIGYFLERMTHGTLPLSIGTSLAIESALGITGATDEFGVHAVTPEVPPLNDVAELWINVRTIFRNIYNSIETDYKDKLLPATALDLVKNEMKLIPEIIEQTLGRKYNVVFYACSYTELPKVFPKAVLRVVKSEKQLHYWNLEQHIAFYFIKQPEETTVKKFNVKLKGTFPTALIITHLAVDLLWRYNFQNLYLLESTTGAIKPYSKWNTKLTDGKEYPQLPFNNLTLEIFGDRGNFFTPYVSGIRKTVLKLSIERRWTPITTRDKIVADIGSIRDHGVRHYLQEACKSW